jgi:anti-sigma factor RsiW
MSEQHLSSQQQERYRSFTLLPDEMADVYAHLETCDACRARVEETAPTNATPMPIIADLLMGEWSEPWHIDNEQASAFVDGRLDSVDRELVTSHLEICAACVDKVRALRAFRALLSTFPAQALQPLPRPTLRSRLLALWRLPAGRFTVQTLIPTAVAAGIVFLLMRASSWHTLSPKDYQSKAAEIARLNQELSALTGRVATTEEAKMRLQQQAEGLRTDAHNLAVVNDQLRERLKRQGGNQPRNTVIAGNLILDHGALALRVPVRPQDRAMVTQAMTEGHLELPPLTDLASHVTNALGSSDSHSVNLIGPKKTFVLSDQPTLRWKDFPGAMRYRLTLSSGQGAACLEARIEPLNGHWTATSVDMTVYPPRKEATTETASGTEWTVPARGKLKAGNAYQWSVDAYTDSFEDDKKIAASRAAAKFQILTSKQRAEVERARAQYANSPLLLGIYDAHQGLLEDAANEFRAYLQVNPADTQAKRLLSDSLR